MSTFSIHCFLSRTKTSLLFHTSILKAVWHDFESMTILLSRRNIMWNIRRHFKCRVSSRISQVNKQLVIVALCVRSMKKKKPDGRDNNENDTNWFANRVRGTVRQRSRRSSNSSTGGAGTATGIRPVPPGRRAGWTAGVPRRADTAWPGRTTVRTRRRILAAGRWRPRTAVTATKTRATTRLPSPPSVRRLLLRRRRRRRHHYRRRRRPVPAESTAPVALRTATTSPWNGVCENATDGKQSFRLRFTLISTLLCLYLLFI